jgi:hypothetical protein
MRENVPMNDAPLINVNLSGYMQKLCHGNHRNKNNRIHTRAGQIEEGDWRISPHVGDLCDCLASGFASDLARAMAAQPRGLASASNRLSLATTG